MSEIPKETQRFILALVLICGFFGVFAYVFHVTKDVEIAKTVLTVLAGALSSIIAFFYGSKSAEVRSAKP
jgi:hypothetical protein